MLNVNNTRVMVSEWFTPKECDQIINYAVNYGWKERPGVGFGSGIRREDKNTRDGTLYFFEHKLVSKKILHHIKKTNKQLWNFDLYNIEPMQLTVYNEGDHYTWHRDQEQAGKLNPRHDKELIRKLSFSINLTNENTDYIGGDLQIHTGLHLTERDPHMAKKGNGMIFLSCLAHRVTPVTQGRRVALVGWVSGPPYR